MSNTFVQTGRNRFSTDPERRQLLAATSREIRLERLEEGLEQRSSVTQHKREKAMDPRRQRKTRSWLKDYES